MYQLIDENEEQVKYNEVVEKITPQSLGLNPTTDFAQYAQQELIDENPDKVKDWINQGSIGVMEAGKRYAHEFNGTYHNIDNNANLNKAETALKNSPINNIVDERIENTKRKKEERAKRIQDGTASILDKIGAGLDSWGDASYQAQVQKAEQEADMQMPHKNDSRYRYKPVSVDRTGRVIYSETDLTKKIDFSEALADSIGKGKAMPFVSGMIEGSGAKKYRDIADRIKKGEAIRQDELDYLNNHIERTNEEFVRGYTLGGQIGKNFLPSLIAFGSEIVLGGGALKLLGLNGAGKALGLSLGTGLLKSGKVSKDIAKAVALTSGTIAEAGLSAGVTSAVNPSRIFATYQERRLNDEMKITDRGTVIFQEAEETPAKAFLKSLGQVYISYFAEGLGGLIGGAGRGIKSVGATQFEKVIKANPKLEGLIKKTAPIFAKAYEKLNKLPIKGKSVEWLKGQVKFDGFIEELGEEVLEDVLNLAVGTNNEERSLENYVSKIVKTPEEWAVLAGVIALQGGTLSIAGNTLGAFMDSNGSSFEDIMNVSENSTEAEKIELIDEAIKKGEIRITDKNLNDEKEIRKNEIENEVYNKFVKVGRSEDEAVSLAKLFGNFYKNYTGNEKAEKVFEEWSKKFDTQFNVPIEKINDDTILQQSATTAGVNSTAEIPSAIKEWNEKGTASKYFKKWFGKSKVVNAFKKPMIVFHGTPSWNEKFDTFKNSNLFYFSKTQKYAQQFTEQLSSLNEDSIYQCYLSIQNPLDLRKFKNKNIKIKDFIKVMEDHGVVLSQNTLENIEKLKDEKVTPIFRFTRLLSKEDVESLKAQGYDGIVQQEFEYDKRYSKFSEDKIEDTAYIAFEPEQIKSVNNKGTFDRNNPNIYFQRKNIEAEGQLKLFQDIVQLNLFQQKQIFVDKANKKEVKPVQIKLQYNETDVQKKEDIENNTTGTISDVGDSLLGNLKKNKKQYTWQELSEMNDLLRKKYVSKSYIYQLPTYEELKKEGLSDKCVAFIHNVYAKINSKPAKGYDKIEHQKIYFDTVHEIMDKTIEYVKENSNVIDEHTAGTDNTLFKIMFPDKDNKRAYNVFRAYPEYNRKVIIVGGNKLIGALYLDYDTEKNLKNQILKFKTPQEENQKDKSTVTGWKKYFAVIEGRQGYLVADQKSHAILTHKDLPSKEIAEDLAEKMYQYLKENTTSFTVDFEDLRNHIPRRKDNQNVKPEALIEVFGFRGVNFGNWTKQSERQDFVNLAYDSLYDLAELLNLPPKALSLGGKLGLAFGAQGRSGASGHFIPEYNEINLTRKTGAGSLAHEWWHALDYYFGDQAREKDFSGVASLTLNDKGSLREEVYKALMDLKDVIKFRPITQAEFEEKKDEYEARYIQSIQYYQRNIKSSFAKSKNAEKINKLVDDIVANASTFDVNGEGHDKAMFEFGQLLDDRRKTFDNLNKMNSLLYHVKNLQRVEEYARASKQYSDYYNKATRLNYIERKSNGYWTKDTELGARAFASYILDKINKQDFKNNFLVRDEKGSSSLDFGVLAEIIEAKQNNIETNKTIKDARVEWYPAQEDERERIFNAFDNLFKEVKTKEHKGTVILFQSDNENSETDKKLIAGYEYTEVLNKLTELYDSLGSGELSKEEEDKTMAKVHVLEDAFEVAENPTKFSNEDKRHEIMLNAYYIMNDQEIPEEYIDADRLSKRTYADYAEIHQKKKEEAEEKYYGYYAETDNKNMITIMSSSNASTALHELGHLFLNGLNELASVDENAKKELEAVNKWLGVSGDYTVEQQEKFARSFEAYLYRGKAPNNSLRKVFENFKEWLRSVYSHITELIDKGADISPEVNEMFDKMFSGDEYYEESKQTKELLKKVKEISIKEKSAKVKVRDNDELDEVEKRHKDVAYQIVSVGTGKSTKYLKTIFETSSNKKSFAKKREAVEMLLDRVDDKITTSGGMRAEWEEFYSDTGVSYDNDEIDGDYKLVEQALNTIVNKSYINPEKVVMNDLEERALYYERAIDEADRQYKALLRSFKNENRNVALSATYEWLEGLDKEIKQDYEDRFVFDSALIERNEHLDKFEKAKRQILSKAMEVENRYGISKDEKYKEVVMEIMKDLSFLQPSDKAKLTTNILDISSVEFLMSSIDNILDIAKTMEDVNYRRNLEREIHKELQTTKNVRRNGRTEGKYNYKTNKIFEELRELDKLSPEKANELRLEVSRFATAEDNGLSEKDKLINKFLSYKAGGRTFADTELMKELYDEITKIKLIGKSAKSELELIEKYGITKDVEELISIVEKKKEAKFVVKSYISGFGNLESTLNALFNKDIKDRYGAEILYAETQSQAWQYRVKTDFENEVAKIYNLPTWCWDKKVIEYLAEKHTYAELRRRYNENGDLIKTRKIDRTLTKMDIIQAYIWSKNEILEKRLINQFGEETLYAMFDELSLQDVKLAELMMSTVQSFYPMVNKAFIRKYGLDLPKVSCYFPSTPERGSEVDLYNDYSSKSLNNSFTKARANSETQPMDFHNPLTTMYNHIDGVAKFAFLSESLDKANQRFKDNDLKRVIINKYGELAQRTLEQILMNVTYKKEAPVFNGVNKVIDNMVGNWIQANVAIKPVVGLKQLLSANNYAVDMPYWNWQKGFLKALSNPKETIDYMMNIPYIKARYGGSFSNEFLKQTIENSAFALSKKLKDSCTLFIRMGDIGAIIFGGKPYIDYLIKEKGLSEEQAIKQFVLSTNRSQQSSAISSLSNFQVSMTRNPFGKLFIAFKNSPQQYVRMCGDAVVSVANGDMSKRQCAKVIFQYAYLQPFLYAAATSGSIFKFLLSGDDDDLLKDLKMSIFDLNASALPLIGDIYTYAKNRLFYDEKFMPQTTPLIGDIQREINRLSKDDVTLKDWLEAIGYMGLHVGLGYNSKAIMTMGSGVGDIFTDDPVKGALKVFGYTENRAKAITKKRKD